MENLQSYRNKRARIHILAGALEFTNPASVEAAVSAANERILARKVEPGEVVIASNGQPIQPGWYAKVEVEDDGLIIIAIEPNFFESLWELDLPRN